MDEPTLSTPLARAILASYKKGEEDELLEPLVLVDKAGNPIGRIKEGDSVIFYDIRGEREIELTEALTDPGFSHFPSMDLGLSFVTMIRYRKGLGVREAFPPLEKLKNTLCEVLSNRRKRIRKITEAEKAIHLSYFLNGKSEESFENEERVILPTRKDVATFDQAPQMSAELVTKAACEALADKAVDAVIVNLCNVDVVGHFENEGSVLKAIETVDESLGKMISCARQNDATSVITADHGTVERWLYPEGTVDTGHTKSPVPFIVDADGSFTVTDGELSDVAPTVLHLLGIEKPCEMNGKTLIDGSAPRAKRILLVILDGWGHNDGDYGNMIAKARTPSFDSLWSSRPHCVLKAAGTAVGLPERSVGNSEVGHLHIGAGRHVPSDRVRIDSAIADGAFMQNEAFLWAIEEAKSRRSSLHLLGIVSFYSSHGSIAHLEALMRLCKERDVDNFFIHAMLGRRGERPMAGARYIGMIEDECLKIGRGKVAGVIGRYWSLDREENWRRIERTYRWLLEGHGTRIIDS